MASDPQALQQEAQAAQSTGTDPLGLALLAIVTAWSVYIPANGIAETHDVSFSDGLFPAIFTGAGSFLLALI